ncbi:MAG: integron integrase [Opitutaceae bacterium]
MVTISFPNWSGALDAAKLPAEVCNRHRIIINWFLGHLKREHQQATVDSARAFVEHLVETRKPAEWQVQQWSEGLNWFFREAPSRRHRTAEVSESKKSDNEHPTAALCKEKADGDEDESSAQSDGRRHYEHTVAEMQAQIPLDPWFEETVRLMRVRHMAYRTEETYLGWIRRMERFLQSKEGLEAFGEEDLKRFLSYLATEEGVAVGTQRQALNAGVFFLREVRKMELGDFSDYVKASPRKYYPVVYSKGEISRLLAEMRGKWSLMARLQYGCGLRISELCRLRVKDVDFERGKLYIRASKGDKDRCVPLPKSLKELLGAHLLEVRKVHEEDRAANLPGVYMPGLLDKKMPKAGSSWAWFWLFPMQQLSKDPRGDTDGPKRRHHILPRAYQKELSIAATKADIPKRSNSHVLRHSYATHLLENGTNIRTVQEFLGHTCVETTMIYLHVMEDQKDLTLSPLDAL